MRTSLSNIKIYEALTKFASGSSPTLNDSVSLNPYRDRAQAMHWWDRLGSNIGTGVSSAWDRLVGNRFSRSRDSSVGKYQPSLRPGQSSFSPYFPSMRTLIQQMDEAAYKFKNSGWAAEDYRPAATAYMNAVAKFKQQLDAVKQSGGLSSEELNAINAMYADSLGRAKDSGLITNSAITFNSNGQTQEIVPETLLTDLDNLRAETMPSSGLTNSSIDASTRAVMDDNSLSPAEKKQELEELKFTKIKNNLDEYNRLLNFRNNAKTPQERATFENQLNALTTESYNDVRRLLPNSPELQPFVAQLYQRAKKDNLSAAKQIFDTEMSDYKNKSLSAGQRVSGYDKWKALSSNANAQPSYHSYLKDVAQENPYQQAMNAKNDMDIAHSYFKNDDGSYNYNLSWREDPNSEARKSTSFTITDADKKMMDKFKSEQERKLWYADKYMQNIPEQVRNNFLAGTTRKDNLYRSPNNGKLIRTADSDYDIAERNRKTKQMTPNSSALNNMNSWNK